MALVCQWDGTQSGRVDSTLLGTVQSRLAGEISCRTKNKVRMNNFTIQPKLKILQKWKSFKKNCKIPIVHFSPPHPPPPPPQKNPHISDANSPPIISLAWPELHSSSYDCKTCPNFNPLLKSPAHPQNKLSFFLQQLQLCLDTHRYCNAVKHLLKDTSHRWTTLISRHLIMFPAIYKYYFFSLLYVDTSRLIYTLRFVGPIWPDFIKKMTERMKIGPFL